MADAQTLRSNTERFLQEVFNDHNADTARELFADDFVDHAIPPGFDNSREGAVKVFEGLWSSFPDLSWETNQIIVSGDRIGIRGTMRGTNTGDIAVPGMPPAPATGKSFEVGSIDIIRANDDGLAAEHWGIFDAMGMMIQLGLMPGAPPA